MLQNLGGAHLIAIVFIVLLIFGAPKLPGLAKSLGQSMRILRKEVRADADVESVPAPATTAATDLGSIPAPAPAPTVSTPAPTAASAPGQPDVR